MKRLYFVITMFMVMAMVLGACATPTPETIIQTVEVPKEVIQTVEVPVEVIKTVEVQVTAEPSTETFPRNETLYFNGQQWGSVVCWNPYSSNCNNAMAITAQDSSRVTMFETPYLYNMLDGKVYPLLANGDYTWNDAHTEITFKIKPAAHWSDGTPVTADDVAYTWASNIKYETNAGVNYKDYIDSITAVDPQTVLVKSKLDANGKTVNPLMVAAYLSSNYVIQKAWTQTLEARTGGDATAFKADAAEDVVWSGPYHKFFADDTKVVYVRDDNYWGQDASMWGKLPAPKYLAHVIYKDNAAGSVALAQGEVDVSQQFNSNVQILWLNYGLPVSTYLPDPPYGIGASLPTAFYNQKSYGLDQLAVRKAIAIAVDYDTIIANAMTNQSATFAQVPRSLMNPTPGEQALYDHAAVADLQWTGKDIEGAKKLLDDAGIKDTDGDGWREYNGKKLSYVATCPNGWSDWQAAIEVVAAAGKDIGIEITTNYPEWAVYQTVVTDWQALPDTGYDIFMMWSDGAGPTQPWGRIRHLISSEFAETQNNWNGNWGGYKNPAADEIIQAIPGETDPAKLKAAYTDLVKIYLTDIPSFTLMYRPQSFHAVNESVWTGFPHQDDGTNPPVPPLDLTDGWSIAGLYNLTLVNP
ncbi:MAG: ABC transporter substrate-binding protein [Chloroflexi bacterium RBG_16_47_49]|nr:MAG: ABC transporter substrate-binding protein [Chloroflexi bacterium RBG_16_47_49]